MATTVHTSGKHLMCRIALKDAPGMSVVNRPGSPHASHASNHPTTTHQDTASSGAAGQQP